MSMTTRVGPVNLGVQSVKSAKSSECLQKSAARAQNQMDKEGPSLNLAIEQNRFSKICPLQNDACLQKIIILQKYYYYSKLHVHILMRRLFPFVYKLGHKFCIFKYNALRYRLANVLLNQIPHIEKKTPFTLYTPHHVLHAMYVLHASNTNCQLSIKYMQTYLSYFC